MMSTRLHLGKPFISSPEPTGCRLCEGHRLTSSLNTQGAMLSDSMMPFHVPACLPACLRACCCCAALQSMLSSACQLQAVARCCCPPDSSPGSSSTQHCCCGRCTVIWPAGGQHSSGTLMAASTVAGTWCSFDGSCQGLEQQDGCQVYLCGLRPHARV